MKDIITLGIESSCDETSVAVVKNGREVLSNIIDTQIPIHEKYGGVVPEIASRNHIEAISRVTKKALKEAKIGFNDIDVIEMSDTDNKNNREWLVLNNKGTNKLETLKILCEKLDIPIDKVIFFGDSTNDLSIIGQVGIGIAMGNALEEVKKQSKYITLSNDNDGIAYYLEKYKNNL